MGYESFYLIRILFLTSVSFLFAFSWTPLLTHFLYKYKMGKSIRNSGNTPFFSKLHAGKAGTPTMGGVLIWATVLFIALAIFYLAEITHLPIFENLNFLSRGETLLPLGALVATALVGMFDDWLDVRGRGVFGGGGLKVRHRLLIYTVIALIGAWWFYFKLDWDTFHIPFYGDLQMGWPYMLIFVFVI
ncbi:hypothetical protein HGA64_05475, partial [Candidatus Falkowbacteria bacterium]|nr:hypothetical protein [Candidatus Falkowbacteria bacterium]